MSSAVWEKAVTNRTIPGSPGRGSALLHSRPLGTGRVDFLRSSARAGPGDDAGAGLLLPVLRWQWACSSLCLWQGDVRIALESSRF